MFLIVILAVSTQPTSAPAPADLSSVAGAVRALWESIRAGDVEGVAKVLDAPDATSQEYAHAVAELLVAGKKMSDVASKRFGKSGQAIGRTMIDFSNLDEVIQKLQITETGETAMVTGENQTKMKFQRREGKWRLVVTDLATSKPANFAAQVKLLHDMATAVNEAARELDSGKYQTVQEAERVIQDRLHAVMIEKFRPTSGPATRGGFGAGSGPATAPATAPARAPVTSPVTAPAPLTTTRP